MFGLSRIQLGIIVGLVAALSITGWLVLKQTERLGLERAASAGLRQAVIDQVQQTQAALGEIQSTGRLLAGVESERDKLAQRKARVQTRIREVLVHDETECSGKALPPAVRDLVQQYAAGGDDSGGIPNAAAQPDDTGPGT